MSTTYGLHRAVLLNRNGVAIDVRGQATDLGRAGRQRRPARRRPDRRSAIGQGDRVAVLSLNQDRYIELYLGVAWVGAVIVPLNIRWSALENEDALRDSRPEASRRRRRFRRHGRARSRRIGSIRLVYADDAPAAAPDGDAGLRTIHRRGRPFADAEAAETPTSPASSTPAVRPAVPKA